MNFEKVGKLIAKQRGEKGMTQEQLAAKLGVDRTAISKWERAVSSPDILLLQPLCNELDLTINELLCGEKNLKSENNDEATINAIKYYNKKSKNKYIKYFTILLTIMICFFLSLLIVNNYNKFEMYKITSSQNDFLVDGYLLSNTNRKVIFIKDIKYNNKYIGTDKEIIADSVTVSLVSNNKVIYKSDNISNSEITSLEEYLDEISIFLDTEETENIDLKELYLNIETSCNNETSNNYINISINKK